VGYNLYEEGYGCLSSFNTDGELEWFKRGNFTNGQMNGYGQHLMPNGDFHEGMYENDKKYGFG